jgi:hypothetical protein
MADFGITGTWLPPYSNLPTYRTTLGLGQDQQDNLYALGGTGADGNPSAVQEVYQPELANWSTATPMPTARSSPAIAVVGTQLFAIGGFTFTSGGPRTALATNEMLDLTTGTWTTCSPMPTARGLAAVGVVDGKIYIVGGQDSESLGDNQVYDPAADDWDIAAPLAVSRGGLAGAVGTTSCTWPAGPATTRRCSTRWRCTTRSMTATRSWRPCPPPAGWPPGPPLRT